VVCDGKLLIDGFYIVILIGLGLVYIYRRGGEGRGGRKLL
jgi:hypothetical protein